MQRPTQFTALSGNVLTRRPEGDQQTAAAAAPQWDTYRQQNNISMAASKRVAHGKGQQKDTRRRL